MKNITIKKSEYKELKEDLKAYKELFLEGIENEKKLKQVSKELELYKELYHLQQQKIC